MNKRRIGVRAIIYKNGRILATKQKDEYGASSDYWAIPGGGLDPMESLEDGLRREIKEELGIDAKVSRLLFIQQFKSSRANCDEELEFFFLIENTDDFMDIDFNSTSHGADELAACEFIEPTKELIRPRFIGQIDLALYVTSAQPVYITNLLEVDD